MSRRATFRVITAAMTVVAFGCTQAWAANASTEPALPRYKLSVGQELAYYTTNNKNSATFYVTRSNPDGGRHVFEIYRYPSPRIKDPVNGGALSIPELKCEFDLMPDGKLGDKPVGRTNDVMTFFPKLPPDAATGEWESFRPQGQSIRFHLLPTTQPSEQDFEGDVEGARQRFLKIRTACRVRFDTARGLPARFEFEFEQPSGQQSRWAIDLVDNQVHPSSWANHFDQEGDTVMQALSRYERAMLAAGGAPDDKQAKAGFAAAVKDLEDVRSQTTIPTLLEVMNWRIRTHPRFAGFVRGRHDAGHSQGLGDNPTQ